MRDHDYWVYIVTNKTGSTLYIGMTNNLKRRVQEHRGGRVKGFTQRYSLHLLVWYEHFREVRDAIACEKRLKGWLRARKVTLIAEMNPRWVDLSAEWFEEVVMVEGEEEFL